MVGLKICPLIPSCWCFQSQLEWIVPIGRFVVTWWIMLVNLRLAIFHSRILLWLDYWVSASRYICSFTSVIYIFYHIFTCLCLFSLSVLSSLATCNIYSCSTSYLCLLYLWSSIGLCLVSTTCLVHILYFCILQIVVRVLTVDVCLVRNSCGSET